MDSIEILIITNGESVDGIISGGLTANGLIKKWEGEANCRFHWVFTRNATICDDFEKAVQKANNVAINEIYVCDIAAINSLLEGDNSLLKQLVGDNKLVTWYDHHIATGENKVKMFEIGIEDVLYTNNSGDCTTDIVVEEFDIQDKDMLNLRKIANAHDCPRDGIDIRIPAIARDIQKAISIINSKEADNPTENSLLSGVNFIADSHYMGFAGWVHEHMGIYKDFERSA